MNGSGFDPAPAHRFFSVECFNLVWQLLDREGRTPSEDEEMLGLAHASRWHWSRREDCDATNISVAWWMISRVCAVLGRADEASRYASLCLAESPEGGVPPFFTAYAHEAAARAALAGGNDEDARGHLAEARRLSGLVEDQEDRKLLL